MIGEGVGVDQAGAEEPVDGHHASERVGRVVEGEIADHRRAHADERERPVAGCGATQLAFEADRPGQPEGDQQPDREGHRCGRYSAAVGELARSNWDARLRRIKRLAESTQASIDGGE